MVSLESSRLAGSVGSHAPATSLQHDRGTEKRHSDSFPPTALCEEQAADENPIALSQHGR